MFKKPLLFVFACLIILSVGCQGKPTDVGTTPDPTPPSQGSAYMPDGAGMIAAGARHTVALRSDGTVLVAGNNTNGQCDVTHWRNIVYIDASDTMTVGVTQEGKLLVAGGAIDGIEEWTDIVMATAGDAHVVALKSDGTVLAAGDNGKGQCNVAEWTNVTAIAADANHTIALQNDGTVVAVGDNSMGQCNVGDWENVVAIDTAREHTAALKADGTAYAAGAGDMEAINVSSWYGFTAIYAGGEKTAGMMDNGLFDATPLDTDIMGIINGISCALGTRHAVFMKTDGTVETTGSNEDLQCEVEGWMLRPYKRLGGLVGFMPGSTVEFTLRTLRAMFGQDVALMDESGEMDPLALIRTGINIYTGGTLYAPLVIIGDVNGDGLIDDADADRVEKHLDGTQPLTGAALNAAMVFSDSDGNVHEESANAIRKYAQGEYTFSQFSPVTTNKYDEKIAAVKEYNDDVVGWISIDNTYLDHPIMYRKDLYYYNERDTHGKSSAAGSVYAYYNVYTKNNVITAHNMRKAKTNRMFHILHHIQEFNNGHTTCQAKDCREELPQNLPDLRTYQGRVWTISIYGVEAKWEVFSMYETKENEPISTRLDNTWWPGAKARDNYLKTTDEEIQTWINKQVSHSEIDFGVVPTPQDTFLTILTCGTEYDSSQAESRLYFFLRKL